MKTSLKITTLFIIFLLSFTACNSTPKAPTINPTQGAQMLAGEYITTITSDDLKKVNSLDPGLSSNVGNWDLVLTADGKFTTQKDGEFIAEGK